METSARNVVNIEETFALLVRRVVAAREEVRNGGMIAQQQQIEAAERRNEKVEVSKMDDYDDAPGGSKGSRWCCTIM